MTTSPGDVSPGPARATASHLWPAASVIGGIVSLAVGTSLAKHLFPAIGAEGTTTVRVAFSAAILVAFWRPWRHPLRWRDASAVALYGGVLGAMNLAFYLALRTIPFGIAVAIEFAGPLTVATLSSRRALDVLWIGLALLGLSQLLPLGGATGPLDPAGLAYAAAAGTAWGFYIVCGQWAGRVRGPDAAALGSVVAAAVVLPFGIARAGSALLDPSLLPVELAVALLSSAVPYSLEMVALQRLPRQTFGVLLSVEPAVAALAGFVLLGEALIPWQWLAICSVVLASVGSTASARRSRI